MNFGRLPANETELIDFKLPADTLLTSTVLKGNKVSEPFHVNVGTHTWGRKEWLGQIYPKGSKDGQMLNEYVKSFNSIELNATYYNIYPTATLAKWYQQADENPNFKFYPKFPQAITHIRMLKNAQAQTDSFLESLTGLGDKLGPCFLQLSDRFSPKLFEQLTTYLSSLPTDLQLFIEVRHPQWFASVDHYNALFDLLRYKGIGAIITDAPGRPDCLHMNLTTPEAFIRFVGTGTDADYMRLDNWVERISQWRQSGLNSVNFFMHQEEERQTPVKIDYLVSRLNEQLGLTLPRPRFIG